MMIIINIGFIVINLIILALNVKLYTEYFKDRSITKRWLVTGTEWSCL